MARKRKSKAKCRNIRVGRKTLKVCAVKRKKGRR